MEQGGEVRERRQKRQAAGARPMSNANQPRFSQIELDPPCGAPNWDKGGWNNKAEPLDCPLTRTYKEGQSDRKDGLLSLSVRRMEAGGELR